MTFESFLKDFCESSLASSLMKTAFPYTIFISPAILMPH